MIDDASANVPVLGEGPLSTSVVNGLLGSVAYGPIRSRRLGNSLGINLLPANRKICSFNCPYCECGWTEIGASKRNLESLPWPTPQAVADEMRAALERCNAEHFPIAFMTMAGNGEPTMHPQFPEVIDKLIQVRDTVSPKTKLAVLSNATTLDRPEIVDALNRLDERMMKIDGGTPETIKQIDLPLVPFSIDEAVSKFARLKDVVVQTMFLGGRIDNTTDDEVAAWIELVRRANPKYVQIYTLDRPAPDATLKPVSKSKLDDIAARLQRETGIEGRVFG